MKKEFKKIFTIIFIASFLIIFSACSSDNTKNNNNISVKKNNDTQNQIIEINDIKALDYEIIREEDISMKALGNKLLSEYTFEEIENLPMAKRMTYRVLVSSDIKENQVRPTVEKIVSDLRLKDNEIDSIHILLYSDKEIVDGSYDVAMATWAPGGKIENITPEIVKNKDRTEYEISLSIRDNLEEYLKSRAEQDDKHGFSFIERQQIFKEIVAAEDKAFKEADRLYPIEIQGNLNKNLDKTFELQEKYNLQINKKFNLTDNIRQDIVLEGVLKKWPTK